MSEIYATAIEMGHHHHYYLLLGDHVTVSLSIVELHLALPFGDAFLIYHVSPTSRETRVLLVTIGAEGGGGSIYIP